MKVGFGAMLVLLGALVACKGSSSSSSSSPKINDTVTFDDSEWVVLEAKDAGKTLKSTSAINEEEKKADGRFIEVHYKVTNKSKKEEMLLEKPKIVDDKNREYEPIEMEGFYVPPNTKTINFDTLQPNTPKDYWTIIQVPPDAKNLKFQVQGFSMLNDKKKIDLNL